MKWYRAGLSFEDYKLMYDMMQQHNLSVVELVYLTGAIRSDSSVRHSLNFLKKRGYVRSRRHGSYNQYNLTRLGKVVLRAQQKYNSTIVKFKQKEAANGKTN